MLDDDFADGDDNADFVFDLRAGPSFYGDEQGEHGTVKRSHGNNAKGMSAACLR